MSADEPVEPARWRTSAVPAWAVTAVASTAVAVAVSVGSIVTAPSGHEAWTTAAWWLSTAGVLALALALGTRTLTLVGVACVAFLAAYAAAHPDAGRSVATSALVVGPAIIAVAELALWSLDLRPDLVGEPGSHRERAGWVGAAVVVAMLVTGALAVASRLRLTGGIALDAAAVGATLGLIVVVAQLATKRR